MTDDQKLIEIARRLIEKAEEMQKEITYLKVKLENELAVVKKAVRT